MPTAVRCALLGAVATVALRAQEVDLFVFAGQSNMSGAQTSVDQIPAAQAAVRDPNPAVQALVPTAGTPPQSGYWLPTQAAWEAYAPYTQRDAAHWWQYYNAGDWWLGQDWAKSFGPELMATRGIAASLGRTIYLVKYSSSGKSLAWDWNPDQADPAGGVSLYHAMTGWVAQARAGLPGARVAGFFWMQGESDGYGQASAEAYAANFTAFIARVRADFAEPALPVVFGQVSPLGRDSGQGYSYAWRDTVRAQQALVATSVPHVAMVTTDDLDLVPSGSTGTDGLPNQIHFSTPSQLTLGTRMGEAYLQLAGSGGGTTTGGTSGTTTGGTTGGTGGTTGGTGGTTTGATGGGSSSSSGGTGSHGCGRGGALTAGAAAMLLGLRLRRAR